MAAKTSRAKPAVRAASNNKQPFYVAIGLVLVIGIGAISYMAARPKAMAYMDSTMTPVPNTGHSLGSDSAPVEVIEFADFECPVCGSFANLTEPDIRARLVLTGQVRYRFMDYPLYTAHKYTSAAHMAAWCAGEQGKFWEMHDAIYQNQDRWTTARATKILGELAQRVGVGMEQYESCMNSSKYAAQIKANAEEGNKRGVGGTPTFFFGKKVIPNIIGYDEFKANVDTLLAAARASAKAGTNKK